MHACKGNYVTYSAKLCNSVNSHNESKVCIFWPISLSSLNFMIVQIFLLYSLFSMFIFFLSVLKISYIKSDFIYSIKSLLQYWHKINNANQYKPWNSVVFNLLASLTIAFWYQFLHLEVKMSSQPHCKSSTLKKHLSWKNNTVEWNIW